MNEINLKMVPFPIVMHNHVDQVNQAYFFLKDWCELDGEIDCISLLNDYMLFCFKMQPEFEKVTDFDTQSFTDWWSE